MGILTIVMSFLGRLIQPLVSFLAGWKTKQARDLNDTLKRTEKGRKAVRKAKNETRDSTTNDLVERLRRNDGKWD